MILVQSVRDRIRVRDQVVPLTRLHWFPYAVIVVMGGVILALALSGAPPLGVAVPCRDLRFVR